MASGKSQNIMIQNQMNQDKFPGATSLQPQAFDFDDEGMNSKGLSQTELQKKKNADRIQKNAEVIVRKKGGSRQASAKRSEAGDTRQGDTKSNKALENMSPARLEDEIRSETIKDFKEFNFDNDGLTDQRTLDPLMPGRLDEYKGEEENLICCRFPHLDFDPMPIDVNEIRPVEVYENIFLGPFQAALCTKTLLSLGITHILNVSAMEYTKRTNYYKYLTLDVYDVQEEDIKKFFRITNRFISEALSSGGKILIHSFEGKSRAPAFALAYLIGRERIPMKKGLEIIKSNIPEIEINPYFMKQIEQYDLEKLAIINVPK